MKVQRDRELTRLYVAAGLAVAVWMFFRAYRMVSAQVAGGVDAPSRWALLALGLVQVLAIGTLLFIMARSLAKVYFEYRRGILGSRVRARLVLALFGIGLLPSLMLFLVGQNFISKNVERWFLPEVQEMIHDGQGLAEAYQRHALSRLDAAIMMGGEADPEAIRQGADLDLVARKENGEWRWSLRPGLALPRSLVVGPLSAREDTPAGRWLLKGETSRVVGLFIPIADLTRMVRLENHARESLQLQHFKDPITTLPQLTFLFLTLLTLFAAVWTGLTLARTIADPVRALAKGAQRVGAGDLEVLLPEEGEDELAFLSKAFNHMTSDLRENRAQLESQAERIERQRAYLDQLLGALPVGVLSWGVDDQLRTLNPIARTWFGLGAGMPEWNDLASEPRLGHLPSLVALVKETGRTHQEDFRVGAEGEGRPVRAVVAPLAGGGILAVLEDLSLLAQAEKRAAWQEVARRMAHEVKNPLTPIQLTAQRMLRRAREGRLDVTVVTEGAEAILTEVASLARLVESFTRFARLPQPHPSRVEVGELVRQVAALYGPTHPRIAWELRLPEAPVQALWDRDMVKRALINFVDNALAAIQGEGTIRFILTAGSGFATLTVEDDGPGVREADRAKLFEPAFSTKERGSGLGLAIVRRIAQDHGGEAFYEPLAPGSRFGLRLPFGHLPDTGPSEITSPAPTA